MKNTFTLETLRKIAAVGLMTVAAGTSPFLLKHIVSAYFKERDKKVAQARAKKIRELEKRKLLEFKELGNGHIRITLTSKGRKLVETYNLETTRLKKPARWDGLWRVISYDIPSSHRRASDAFRRKIRSLGLFPLQRSIWVSPYDCLGEIEFLAAALEINSERSIIYFATKEIPREAEVKKFFHL